MKEFTGRICDNCGEEEELKKFYTLVKGNCGHCDKEVVLCKKCWRFNIDHSKTYPCKICRRDIKLTEIGI